MFRKKRLVIIIILILLGVSAYVYMQTEKTSTLIIMVIGDDEGDFEINFGCETGQRLATKNGIGVITIEANTIVNIKNHVGEFIPYDIRRVKDDSSSAYFEKSERIKSLVKDLSFNEKGLDVENCDAASISFSWQK